jgi:hypothetical protein
MLELKKYGENIEAMREKMGLSKSSDKLHKSFKSKESKLLMSRGETHQMSGSGGQHNNHLDQRGEHHLNGGSGTGPYSNHIPPSAAVVEVNPSGTDNDKSSHLHENMASSEPSSPGSPRDLQIDLDNSRSPGKKRVGGSSTNVLNAIRRNIPGSLDFNEGTSPQAVGGNLSQLSRGVVKGRKAGDRLSAVLSNLTRRAGIIGGQGGAVTPVSVTIGGSGASALENMDTDEPDEANGQGQSDNPFSSIYHDRNKTAIALVDPDSHKRKRNINKRFTDQQPPAKKSKVQANASSKQSSKETGGTGGASSTEPALITTSTSEITVNIPSLVNLRPEVPTAVGSSTSVSPQSSTGSPKTKGQHHPPHHHHQQQPSQLQNQLQSSTSGGGSTPGGGGGGGTTTTPGRQNTTATGKKKTKKSKQSGQNRSPTKGVSKAAANSTHNRALVTASSSSSSASHSVSAAAVTSLTQSPSHTVPATTTTTGTTGGAGVTAAAAGAGAGQDSLSNLRIGVRGEEAAPGINDDDSNDFTEGSGLFADTVRKVNQSFRARVNHLTGNSEDMGYQYFTEKVNIHAV